MPTGDEMQDRVELILADLENGQFTQARDRLTVGLTQFQAAALTARVIDVAISNLTWKYDQVDDLVVKADEIVRVLSRVMRAVPLRTEDL